jgi:alanyl-tRNA synthetase
VEFVSGARALRDYRSRHRALRAAALAFTTEDLRVPERVQAVLGEQRTLRSKIELLEEDLRERLLEAWTGEVGSGPFNRTLEEGRAGWLSPLAGALADRRGEPVLLASVEGEEARVVLGVPAGTGTHAGNALRGLLEEVGGRGGGSDRLGQGKLAKAALPRLLDRWRAGDRGR